MITMIMVYGFYDYLFNQSIFFNFAGVCNLMFGDSPIFLFIGFVQKIFFSNSSFIPIKSYSNADTMKQQILDENRKKSGIYRWVNNINGRSYVGSAVNIGLRLSQHFKGDKSNIPLQNAINKYGLNNFSIHILEYCDKLSLIITEQYYFNLIEQKYNIYPTAGSPLGHKPSEDSRNKMSNAKKGEKNYLFGKNLSKEIRTKMSQAKGTTVFLYSLDFQLLNIFSSIRAVTKHLNSYDHTISKYIKSRAVFRNEYILSLSPLEKNFDHIYNIDSPGKALTIYLYSLDHELLKTFSSATQAAKYLKSKKETIIKYARSGEIFRDQYILSLNNNIITSS